MEGCKVMGKANNEVHGKKVKERNEEQNRESGEKVKQR